MESKVGAIFSLIGGILQLASALTFITIGISAFMFGAMSGPIVTPMTNTLDTLSTVYSSIFIILAIIYIAVGILSIFAYKWMKDPMKTKKGGITALVCGIVGFNVITLIGGILGLVDSGK